MVSPILLTLLVYMEKVIDPQKDYPLRCLMVVTEEEGIEDIHGTVEGLDTQVIHAIEGVVTDVDIIRGFTNGIW